MLANIRAKYNSSYKCFQGNVAKLLSVRETRPQLYDSREVTTDKQIIELEIPEFDPQTGARIDPSTVDVVVVSKRPLYTGEYIAHTDWLLDRLCYFTERFYYLLYHCYEENKHLRAVNKSITVQGFESLVEQAIMRRARLFRLGIKARDIDDLKITAQILRDIIADPTPLFEQKETDRLLEEFRQEFCPEKFTVQPTSVNNQRSEVKDVG